MYEELVKRLREHGEFLIASDRMKAPPNVNVRNVFAEDYAQAADAIETMCEMVATAQNELANVIQSYEESKPRWIPVAERLPEDGSHALVMRIDYVTNRMFYDLLWFDKGEWWNRNFRGDYAATHWMPLPEPPKEET